MPAFRKIKKTETSDNPPAPLPTDEQISRLLQEIEVLQDVIGSMGANALMARWGSESSQKAIDGISAKLAAK